MTDKQTTRAAVRRYLRNPNQCPFCEAPDLTSGELLIDEIGEAYQWIECCSCGGEWRDVYRLAHADGFEQGEHAIRHGFNL